MVKRIVKIDIINYFIARLFNYMVYRLAISARDARGIYTYIPDVQTEFFFRQGLVYSAIY